MEKLAKAEIVEIVDTYIGEGNGTGLAYFSHPTLKEFFQTYGDVNTNPHPSETKRDIFIRRLEEASLTNQVEILKALLRRLPEGSSSLRTAARVAYIQGLINRLEAQSHPVIASPNPNITSAIVDRTIADAEALISTNGAPSAVDRVHTMLHGYFKTHCARQGISYSEDALITTLFKLLRTHHPNLQDLGSRAEDIQKIFNSFATILDVLSPIRNRASVAHPNENLLNEAEALLVIHAARTILHYLDSKLC